MSKTMPWLPSWPASRKIQIHGFVATDVATGENSGENWRILTGKNREV